MIEIDNPAHCAPSGRADSSEMDASGENPVNCLDDLPTLHALNSALVGPFEQIMRLAARLFDVPAAAIVLSYGGALWQQSYVRFEAQAEPTSGLGSALLALEKSRAAQRSERKVDTCSLARPVDLGNLQARFYAGVPLIGKDGSRLGTLCLLGAQHREFSEAEVATLMDLAAIAVGDIELRLSSIAIARQNLIEPQRLPRMGMHSGNDLLAHQRSGRLEREDEKRYQSLIGLLSDWHWEQDEKGRFALIAEAGQKKTPEQFEQYIGKRFFEIPALRMPEKEMRLFTNLLDRRRPFQEVIFQWHGTNDTLRYLSISGQPIFSSEGRFQGYRGVTKDVTEKISFQEELARSNAALRELSDAQQVFREAERKRIARELHDELAQLLATSRMELCLLQRDLKPASPTLKRLDTVDRMIGSSIVSLRKLATDLRPSSLDEGELFYALRSLLKTVSEHSGIECQLIAHETDLTMDERRSTAIFRLIEECITNIDRHADARKAVIQIYRHGNAMEIRVQDDGKGIRQEEVDHMKTFGLMQMRERVMKMDGTFKIKGVRGKGTRITVSLPNFFVA